MLRKSIYLALLTYRVEKIGCVVRHHYAITPARTSCGHVRRSILRIFTEWITTQTCQYLCTTYRAYFCRIISTALLLHINNTISVTLCTQCWVCLGVCVYGQLLVLVIQPCCSSLLSYVHVFNLYLYLDERNK